MGSSLPPAPALVISRSAIVNKDGTASWEFVKILQNWALQINNSLNLLGQFVGVISSSATVVGRPGTLASAIQNLDGAGRLAATAITGTVPSGQLPTPTIGTIGGVQANNPTAHEWVNSISTAGVPQLSQPAFTDISGTAAAAQIPPLSGLTGAVTAAQVPALSALTGRITTGQLPTAGASGTVNLAKLTGPGSNGTLTLTNGIITAFVNPT